jgi:thioredoxin reductase (NADPH)
MTLTSRRLSEWGEDSHLWLIHRLDRNVGGLIVFARSKAVAAELSSLVADGKLRKHYFAVCDGICEGGEYDCKALIIAVGVKHRQLGLERENELCGNGVSYCAVCDGAFYKGKTVGVVGGGNSALQEAILLSETSEKVYVIQNLDILTGETKLQNKLKTLKNVDIILGATVEALHGGEELNAVTVKTAAGECKIDLDGLYIAIGLLPKNEIYAELATLNMGGYFDSDESCKTATDGVFVAGDCRQKSIRQITTATADGAVAALAACRYLESL